MQERTAKKTDLIALLKEEVINHLGRPINNSRDCILLSDDINNRLGERISANTLRRFFGLISSDYLSSDSSLEILCRYCGFDHPDELLIHYENSKVQPQEKIEPEAVLNYLISFFKCTPLKDYNDETFLAVVKNTLSFLQQYPFLRDRFQRAIARTKSGQEFYYEQFINIDELNGYYGNGLRYYLLENRTSQGQIFGNALLCLRAWFTDNSADVKKYHDEVMRFKPTREMHSFVCGRYFATQIFYADMAGKDVERIFIDANKCHETIVNREENFKHFPGFEYTFAFSLMVTGHYEVALYYVHYACDHYDLKPRHLEEGFYQSLILIKAYCLARTGKKSEAEAVYATIQPSRFYLLTKKALTMAYILLEHALNKQTPDFENRFQELVRETGFIRFNSVLKLQ